MGPPSREIGGAPRPRCTPFGTVQVDRGTFSDQTSVLQGTGARTQKMRCSAGFSPASHRINCAGSGPQPLGCAAIHLVLTAVRDCGITPRAPVARLPPHLLHQDPCDAGTNAGNVPLPRNYRAWYSIRYCYAPGALDP